jgi:hypothetical protein
MSNYQQPETFYIRSTVWYLLHLRYSSNIADIVDMVHARNTVKRCTLQDPDHKQANGEMN